MSDMFLIQSRLIRLLSQVVLGLGLLLGGHVVNAQASATVETLPGRPLWSDLTDAQHQALAPLSELWPTMREPHKRKWLALSENFSQLSADEQSVLQGRMTGWAKLSPRQRAAARLNFANVKQLSPEELRTKWEAYQALSPEAKKKLAAQHQNKMVGAAPAVKPTTADKLTVPATPNSNKPLPRISTDRLEPVTLLPTSTSAVSLPAASAPEEAVEPVESSTSSQ
jgi:Protein of unknown function (DUF3106)